MGTLLEWGKGFHKAPSQGHSEEWPHILLTFNMAVMLSSHLPCSTSHLSPSCPHVRQRLEQFQLKDSQLRLDGSSGAKPMPREAQQGGLAAAPSPRCCSSCIPPASSGRARAPLVYAALNSRAANSQPSACQGQNNVFQARRSTSLHTTHSAAKAERSPTSLPVCTAHSLLLEGWEPAPAGKWELSTGNLSFSLPGPVQRFLCLQQRTGFVKTPLNKWFCTDQPCCDHPAWGTFPKEGIKVSEWERLSIRRACWKATTH